MMETEGREAVGMSASHPSSGGSGDVILRVKSANPSCEDLEFPTKSSCLVREIKERIKTLSSQHPDVKEQRLIFSGHLLDDEEVLGEVLKAKNFAIDLGQPVTFHLACTSKYIFSSGGGEGKKTTVKQEQKTGDVLNGAATIPQQPMFQGQGVPNMFEVPPQEVFAPQIHQQYVEQMAAYMNQWYMFQQANMPANFFYQVPHNYIPTATANPTPIPENVQNQQAAAPAPAQGVQNPPQPQAVRAEIARVDDDDQRDMLDLLYTFSRVILILSVVYFYSSFSRFILVVLFTGLVIMLQRRNGQQRNGAGLRAENPAAAAPAPAAAPAAEAEAPVNDNQPRDDNNPVAEQQANNPENPQPENEPPAPPPRSLQDIAWTFLTTFFTSLIPENPQH